ncbi:hypothetical protein C8F04DRAFT_1186694 [Mycena alexandri]|uniref:Lysozyme n=1 Tax=Mycena alexandri TaxID=1745969 RepID=A0AAD6SM58_9AGAR|nr:hypothetical protein C8F04DRAFT_1186694 [Mycena alexandri]
MFSGRLIAFVVATVGALAAPANTSATPATALATSTDSSNSSIRETVTIWTFKTVNALGLAAGCSNYGDCRFERAQSILGVHGGSTSMPNWFNDKVDYIRCFGHQTCTSDPFFWPPVDVRACTDRGMQGNCYNLELNLQECTWVGSGLVNRMSSLTIQSGYYCELFDSNYGDCNYARAVNYFGAHTGYNSMPDWFNDKVDYIRCFDEVLGNTLDPPDGLTRKRCDLNQWVEGWWRGDI